MEDGEKKAGEKSHIKWFSEISKESIPTVGGKGANLGEMFNSGFPVPPGFVITAQAYAYFIETAGIKNKIQNILKTTDVDNTKELEENSKKVREIIISSELPKDLEQQIIESYASLDINNEAIKNSGGIALDVLKRSNERSFVAVRSSATTEDLAEASFAGQQESFINIKGDYNLLKAVKKCFASLFTARAIYYRKKKGFAEDSALLAVVIQKMIDSEKAGVIFSRDPVNPDQENIVIEAVYGQGEGIVSGTIKPDHHLVTRSLEILETTLADKKIAIGRNSAGEIVQISLTPEKSHSQVLKESEIKKLAEYAIKLEEHYGKPQDIEFALEAGDIYILQTRPITTLNLKQKQQEIKGDVILEGLAASGGIASGTVKIVKTIEDLEKIQKGDILVTVMTDPDMVVSMQKCAAIVTDEGGMTAHAAIVSREMGIPAVVGTQNATKTLKDGDVITVDGFKGKVYSGKIAETQEREVLAAVQGTNLKIKVNVDLPSAAARASKTGIKTIGLIRLEGIIAENGKHPLSYLKHSQIKDYEQVIYQGLKEIMQYFDEAWVRTSDIRSDEFKNLEGAPKEIEANPMLGMHGIRFSLKNKEILQAEINALKRIAAENKKMGIMLPQVILVEEVLAVKELVGENLNLGVMIETPAAVQIIEELCLAGIKFISFGTNDLTQYTLAIDRGNEQVQYLYNEMHPAVLAQIEFSIIICKEHNVETSICGQAANNKEMVAFLLEVGIDGISVNADSAYEISNFVKSLENQNPQIKESKEKEQIPAFAIIPTSANSGKQKVFEDPRVIGIIQEYIKQKEIESVVKGMQMLFGDHEEKQKINEKDPLNQAEEDEILDIF